MSGITSDAALPSSLDEMSSPISLVQNLNFRCSHEIQKILKSARAKALASATCLPEAHLNSTIADVLRMLENEYDVFFVRGFSPGPTAHVNGEDKSIAHYGKASNRASDVVYTRRSLFQVALECSSMLQPLCSILGKMTEVSAFVRGDDSLESVVALMVTSEVDEVGVIDQGVVRGIITLKRVISFIRHQEQSNQGQSVMKEARHRASICSVESNEGNREIKTLAGQFAGSSRFASGFGHQAHAIATSPDSNVATAGAFHSTESIASKNSSGPFEVQRIPHAERYSRTCFSESQKEAQNFCASWCCELLIVICLLLHAGIGLSDFFSERENAESGNRSTVANGCFLTVLFYERLVRLYGFFQRMKNHPGWLVDSVVVDISVLVYILVTARAIGGEFKAIVTFLQALRLVRVFCSVPRFSFVRRAVSSEKKRYTEDGFDLDLTYITNSCIAMSLPALGAEASYRNPLSEVQRFFATKHVNHFWIFNLCKERYYDPELFDGRVDRFEVEDHNPPRLHQIVAFVERAGEFIEEDPENCIAVHCKGGKGRTGVMICAWLMYSQHCSTAEQAMELFSDARTAQNARSQQGVTQPSQRRYVHYMGIVLARGGYFSPQIYLRSIVMKTCPRVCKDGGYIPWFTIEEDGRLIYDYRTYNLELLKMNKSEDRREFQIDAQVQGDVRIVFYHQDGSFSSFSSGDLICFFLCFHTCFVESEQLAFLKHDIDMAHNDQHNKIFQESFAVELNFDRISERRTGAFRTIIQPSRTLNAAPRSESSLRSQSPPRPTSRRLSRSFRKSPSRSPTASASARPLFPSQYRVSRLLDANPPPPTPSDVDESDEILPVPLTDEELRRCLVLSAPSHFYEPASPYISGIGGMRDAHLTVESRPETPSDHNRQSSSSQNPLPKISAQLLLLSGDELF